MRENDGKNLISPNHIIDFTLKKNKIKLNTLDMKFYKNRNKISDFDATEYRKRIQKHMKIYDDCRFFNPESKNADPLMLII